MTYQAVIRDASDQLVTNQDMGMQISILQGTSDGTPVYVETQSSTSNINGLVSIEIGTGTATDDFSAIDWAAGPYFIKTETDPTTSGGTTYTIIGTSQLLSIPYALHAKTVEFDQVDDADADATNEFQDLNLNGTTLEISNGTNADLSSLQDGTGTDDQNIANLGLSGTTLMVGIEDGTSQTVDLAGLQDGVGDGSETNITAGTNITGTSGDPYIINENTPIYTIDLNTDNYEEEIPSI